MINSSSMIVMVAGSGKALIGRLTGFNIGYGK